MRLGMMGRLAAGLMIVPLIAGGAGPAPAQTESERAALDRIVARGRLLFAIDRAAWVASDDLLAHFPNAAQAGVRGYIVDRIDGHLNVIFYAIDNDRLVAAYRAVIGRRGVDSREIYPAGQRPELTAIQSRMAVAAVVAGTTRERPCGNRPFNALVIPPATADDPVEVYLLTPEVDRALPLGGHFMITVSPDRQIVSTRQFANTCLTAPPPNAPAGARMAGLVVSHRRDPLPTEIHVFTSLAAGLPLIVMIGPRVWRVTGDAIRLTERPGAPGQPR